MADKLKSSEIVMAAFDSANKRKCQVLLTPQMADKYAKNVRVWLKNHEMEREFCVEKRGNMVTVYSF